MHHRRGIVNTRTLLALLITLSILPLLISVFKFCAGLNFSYNEINNELALIDLRRILLIAYDLKVNEKELNFIYHEKDYSLRLVNNKLILQPGTQIYLNNIDDVNFYTKNDCIYVSYQTTEGKEYENNIGKEKGIYLEHFSNNNDQLLEPIFDDE